MAAADLFKKPSYSGASGPVYGPALEYRGFALSVSSSAKSKVLKLYGSRTKGSDKQSGNSRKAESGSPENQHWSDEWFNS